MKQIVLATLNKGKIKEINEILANFNFDFKSLYDFRDCNERRCRVDIDAIESFGDLDG